MECMATTPEGSTYLHSESTSCFLLMGNAFKVINNLRRHKMFFHSLFISQMVKERTTQFTFKKYDNMKSWIWIDFSRESLSPDLV